MIKIVNVSKYYNKDTKVLDTVSIHIKPGEFVSLVGQSGTGKTSLVKIIIAEERASAGRIIVGGWDVTDIRKRDLPFYRRQIGVVFQDYKLLHKKTVFENIAFGLEVCGAPLADVRKTVPQLLKIVNLERQAGNYPYELSGGEQQRVAIARALVNKPKLLIADEPTGNLDMINSKEIIDLLRKINSLGTTVLLVSHDRDIVNRIKKRVITLDRGCVVSDQELAGKYIL